MDCWVKVVFFALVVRPLVLIGLGLNIVGRQNLPTSGPAVVAANHNSHLDTLVLLSLFPLALLPRIRPVAAADYFMHGSKLKRWFALHCIGIIPLDRVGQKSLDDNLSGCHSALDNSEILVLFPEGSRGTPEKMSRLKKGISHLLKDRPEIPVIPIRLYGLGKALPKGEALFVPFNCDVAVGEPLKCEGSSKNFIEILTQRFEDLTQHLLTRNRSLD